MSDKPIALITGASRGIGRATAVRLAEGGYHTILTGRNAASLEESRVHVVAAGDVDCKVITADLSKPEEIARLAKEAGERVDVLVNNAGLLHAKPFLELTDEEISDMLNLNLVAIMRLTRHVLPQMLKRESGSIVNIASLAAKNGFAGGSGYCASKFGLRGFASSLMQEVRNKNVRVITVFPGSVDTGMIARYDAAPRPDSMLQPDDVAEAILTAISLPVRATISELDLRPSNPQKR